MKRIHNAIVNHIPIQENIKANKQKIGALTEVKEELATQLELRDNQIQDLNKTNKQVSVGLGFQTLRIKPVSHKSDVALKFKSYVLIPH